MIGQQLGSSSFWSGATYDPQTEGAIQFVSFTWNQFGTGQTLNAYQYLRPGFRQGSDYFQFVTNNTPTGTWSAYNSGNLTQNNFCNIAFTCGSGAVRPDFSASGGVIQFGYYTISGSFLQTLPYNQTINVDNFGVSVTSAIPEPGTMSLLSSAAAGLMWIQRRRRSQTNASTNLDT